MSALKCRYQALTRFDPLVILLRDFRLCGKKKQR
jgi:hypothetical protein